MHTGSVHITAALKTAEGTAPKFTTPKKLRGPSKLGMVGFSRCQSTYIETERQINRKNEGQKESWSVSIHGSQLWLHAFCCQETDLHR